MKFDLNKIRELTVGAASVEQADDGIHFYRFTKEQMEMYKVRNSDFYTKTFSTSGVHMEFETDAEALDMTVSVSKGSSRSYFGFDLYINGEYSDSLKNFSKEDENTLQYHKLALSHGRFKKKFHLGTGKKTVKLVFPWSAIPVLEEMTAIGATYASAVKKSRKMLAFGDSITHGYDAMYPSKSYAELTALAFDAEIRNKAIGGEIFCPELASLKDNFAPDFITVAYGTNDWSNILTEKEFEENCRGFITALIKNYPGVKIFALTPIWRDVTGKTEKFCTFDELDGILQKIYADYEEVICISCRKFVPESSKYFADLTLHPNDLGFGYYAEGVVRELKKYL